LRNGQFGTVHFATFFYLCGKYSANMDFFNRETEIERLHVIKNASEKHAQMTVVTGRRRIGKTQLLLEATKNYITLYFFIAKKSEQFLCQDFVQEIKNKLSVPILGEINSFSLLFEYLMDYSKSNNLTVIIDEFQEFYNINPSIYSDIQRIWDLNKDSSKMNLLLSGSVYSLMHKIFENYKEPLFGRANNHLRVKPFKTNVLKDILQKYNSNYTNEDLLALYAFTGGIAKYIQLFIDNGAFTKDEMVEYMIKEDSILISEGKNILIEEFGKEYTIYFSILSSIAKGENTRAKIESLLQKEIGGYLTRLERDFGIISKSIPLFSKSETKNVRYIIDDNFLNFWFRFIFKYSHMIEISAFLELKTIILRDFETYSGIVLERYFMTKMKEIGGFTEIGGYWDRKGLIEIDFIGINELNKTADFVEIKRNKNKIDNNKLEQNTKSIINDLGVLENYQIRNMGWSLEDM
jgi:uncharacterized protein